MAQLRAARWQAFYLKRRRARRRRLVLRFLLGVLLGLAFALLMVVAIPAEARTGCQSTSCVERVARKQCSQVRVLPCVKRAAIHYRVSYAMLKRKAWCESRWNPYAVSGPHAGLFQFRVASPSTWATTPYAMRWPFSAKFNSLAAGWMHHVGRGGEWACR